MSQFRALRHTQSRRELAAHKRENRRLYKISLSMIANATDFFQSLINKHLFLEKNTMTENTLEAMIVAWKSAPNNINKDAIISALIDSRTDLKSVADARLFEMNKRHEHFNKLKEQVEFVTKEAEGWKKEAKELEEVYVKIRTLLGETARPNFPLSTHTIQATEKALNILLFERASAKERVDCVEKQSVELRHALGLLTTLKSNLVLNADQPVQMATELVRYLRAQQEDAERTRVQLAGCLVAAEGGTNPDQEQLAKPGNYGWSQAYQAVLNLRRAFDRHEERIANSRKGYAWVERRQQGELYLVVREGPISGPHTLTDISLFSINLPSLVEAALRRVAPLFPEQLKYTAEFSNKTNNKSEAPVGIARESEKAPSLSAAVTMLTFIRSCKHFPTLRHVAEECRLEPAVAIKCVTELADHGLLVELPGGRLLAK